MKVNVLEGTLEEFHQFQTGYVIKLNPNRSSVLESDQIEISEIVK